MANFSRFSRKRLGEILVNEGLITTQQIQEALDAQGNTGEMLGETLVRLGYITEEKIAITLAEQFQLPYITASSYDVPKEMSKLIPVQYMLDHLFVPLDTFDKVIIVAVAGLLSDEVLDEIRERTGCEVFPYIATMGDVRQALEKLYPELFQLGPSASRVQGIEYTQALGHEDEEFESAEAALDAALPSDFDTGLPAGEAPPPRVSPAPAPAAGPTDGNSGNSKGKKKKPPQRPPGRPAKPAGGGPEDEDTSWESLFDEADESVRKDLTD